MKIGMVCTVLRFLFAKDPMLPELSTFLDLQLMSLCQGESNLAHTLGDRCGLSVPFPRVLPAQVLYPQ